MSSELDYSTAAVEPGEDGTYQVSLADGTAIAFWVPSKEIAIDIRDGLKGRPSGMVLVLEEPTEEDAYKQKVSFVAGKMWVDNYIENHPGTKNDRKLTFELWELGDCFVKHKDRAEYMRLAVAAIDAIDERRVRLLVSSMSEEDRLVHAKEALEKCGNSPYDKAHMKEE